jgi:very-short-patch-repair endonuclease
MSANPALVRMARQQGKIPARIDSEIEAKFALHCGAENFPRWERNYRIIPGRKLEWDFAWVGAKFAVEVQGAVHRIEAKFHTDAEKMALALLAGWTVLPVTGRHVRSGQAIAWAKSLLWERAPL